MVGAPFVCSLHDWCATYMETAAPERYKCDKFALQGGLRPGRHWSAEPLVRSAPDKDLSAMIPVLASGDLTLFASHAGPRVIDWETIAQAKQGYEPVLAKNDLRNGQYEGLAQRLMDAVVITTYNKWVYFHQNVDWEQRLCDSFETDTLASKRAKGEGDADGVDSIQIGSGPQVAKTQQQAVLEKGMVVIACPWRRSTLPAIARKK